MLESLDTLDRLLLPYITAWHSPWLDSLMVGVTRAGSKGTIWLLLAAWAWRRPLNRAAAWRVLLTVGLCYALVGLLVKPVTARLRPAGAVSQAERVLPEIPQSSAFPSDRATAAFGAAVAVSRIWPHLAAVWWTVAIAIGYSLVYIGHHYPTDVLAGTALGVAIALWVLGGRHPATDMATLPQPLPAGLDVKP